MATIERDRQAGRAQDQPSERATDNPNGIAPEEDRQTEIAQRAYDLYLNRGAGDGHDLDDWLQAEGEVRDRSR